MCRHVAYLGQPMTLQALLLDPPCGLLRQSYAPRLQRHGTVNADGYGVAWWGQRRPEPAIWRRAVPMWTDRSLSSAAGVIASGCVLAAVRSATAPSPAEESATAPFPVAGRVALSHNGAVDPAAVRTLLPPSVMPAQSMDSALLAALLEVRLRDGEDLAAALGGVVRDVARVADGRLNLLAANGSAIAATRWGDTLFIRVRAGATVVASEPSDDKPGWVEVPDRSLVSCRSGVPPVISTFAP